MCVKLLNNCFSIYFIIKFALASVLCILLVSKETASQQCNEEADGYNTGRGVTMLQV
jgi:hypothetical protein